MATLIAVDGREVELGFDPTGPRVSLASRVTLNFGGEKLKDGLELAARVLVRRDSNTQRIYRFLLEGEIEEQLKRALRRRDAFRVSPHPVKKVSVELSALDGPKSARDLRVSAELVNISLLGLSLRVHHDVERDLAASDHVVVRLRLPDEDTPISIQGLVVRRHMHAGAVSLGIEIEGMQESAANHAEERITRFVVRRQMEELGRG